MIFDCWFMLAAKETACIMLVIRLNFLHSLRRMLSKKKNLIYVQIFSHGLRKVTQVIWGGFCTLKLPLFYI